MLLRLKGESILQGLFLMLLLELGSQSQLSTAGGPQPFASQAMFWHGVG